MLISVTTENLLWIWFKSLTVFLVYSIYRFTHNAIHPRFLAVDALQILFLISFIAAKMVAVKMVFYDL